MTTAGDALVLMTKAPQAGRSKTRLVPPLTAEEAADLAQALLIDQLGNLSTFRRAARFIAFTPDSAAESFAEYGRQGYTSFPQRGVSLGERMVHAFEHLFAAGFARVVLIGGDLPVIPLAFFEQAFGALESSEATVVLGPSADGGYYLVGMNRLIVDIFAGIVWSRDDVLVRTTDTLRRLKLPYELLPTWYDIDTAEDLTRWLAYDGANRNVMKNTLTLLQELRQRGRV
jgi:rSAM/selenodomain-associated transferase 1